MHVALIRIALVYGSIQRERHAVHMQSFCLLISAVSCFVGSYNLVLEHGSLLFVTESCSSFCDSSGCWGPGDDQCLQCAGYSLHGRCVDFCDLANGYFLNSTTRECWPCHPECLNSCTGPVSAILLHTCNWDPVFSCSLCNEVRHIHLCDSEMRHCSKTTYTIWHVAIYYAARYSMPFIKRPSVRSSICLSCRSTAAVAVGGFAAEVGRGQQISIDSCCSHMTCRPHKFWPDWL